MKSVTNMSKLFEKLDDLKVVFSYGQRIIPVLQSLIDFMRETVPLLENVNNSISESTSAMPKASDKINNVNNVTEMATTEILDLVDSITEELTNLSAYVVDLKEYQEEKELAYNELKKVLKGDDRALKLLNRMNGFARTAAKLESIKAVIDKINQSLFNITLSLQVQDITSQQLASVNHLISSVQNNLQGLLIDIDVKGDSKNLSELKINVPDESTFNGEADYSKSTERQDLADSLLRQNASKTTQDEIDKLFS